MTDRRDLIKIVELLEDTHRHDLALHLFSAHLLHRVNPLFPRRDWSSWPVPSSKVPEVPDLYEDSLEKQILLPIKQAVPHEETDDQLAMNFKRSTSNLVIQKKREGHLPNAILLNAIVDVIERTVDRKLASQSLTMNPEHQTGSSRVLALKIANRVSRTLWRLQKINDGKTKKARLSNWQDVHIASVMGRPKTARAPIESYRKSYQKARSLFVEREQEYEYDSTPYGSEEDSGSDSDDGMVSTAPDFEIDQNLEAIENEGTLKTEKGSESGASELDRRKHYFMEREQVFISAWDDAAASAQLSFHNDNEASYEASGVMKEEKNLAVAHNFLGENDYRIHFTK